MLATVVLVGGVVVVASAVTDFRKGTIPNVVTLGGIIVALVVHVVNGALSGGVLGGMRAGGLCLASAIATAIVPFISWRRGELGGGDVKLFAAIGALVGLSMGLRVEAMAYVFVLTLLFPYRLARSGAVGVLASNARRGLSRLMGRDRRAFEPLPKIPSVVLGPTIAAAFLVVAALGALES